MPCYYPVAPYPSLTITVHYHGGSPSKPAQTASDPADAASSDENEQDSMTQPADSPAETPNPDQEANDKDEDSDGKDSEDKDSEDSPAETKTSDASDSDGKAPETEGGDDNAPAQTPQSDGDTQEAQQEAKDGGGGDGDKAPEPAGDGGGGDDGGGGGGDDAKAPAPPKVPPKMGQGHGPTIGARIRMACVVTSATFLTMAGGYLLLFSLGPSTDESLLAQFIVVVSSGLLLWSLMSLTLADDPNSPAKLTLDMILAGLTLAFTFWWPKWMHWVLYGY